METPSTTLEVPVAVRDRLLRLKSHGRQAYHEVITAALDALERVPVAETGQLDPVVARHRDQIRKAVRANKGKRVWLFGSRARGDGRPYSDIDLVVEFAKDASLWDHAGLIGDLQDLLPVPVDVVSLGGLKGDILGRTRAEWVEL